MWLMLALAVTDTIASESVLAVLFAVLIHFYLVLDHIDGMQAKKTGTSSPLGEYLDHFLDVFHGAISIIGIFALIRIESPTLFFGLLWLTYLAFAATMVEEKETGVIRFGYIGSMEAVLFFIAFFLSWSIPELRRIWNSPLISTYPAYYVLIIGGAAGAAITILDCLRRIGRIPLQFTLFTVGGLILLSLLHRWPIPLVLGTVIITLYCADYTGRVIGNHLLGERHPSPDLIAPFGFLILLIDQSGPALLQSYAIPSASVLIVYLGVRCGAGIIDVLGKLKIYWLWLNP